MRNFAVTENGLLLEYLYKVLADTKKTRVKEFLTRGAVFVNGSAVTRYNHPLAPGDEISVQTEGRPLAKPVPAFGVKIVYEDDAIVVAEKPAGLLTVGSETVRTQTAIHAVNEYLNRKAVSGHAPRRQGGAGRIGGGKKIFIVHRLDRDASGLIVFAKNQAVKYRLQARWEDVRKGYYAVVRGAPKEKAGTLAGYLRENKFLKVYSTSNPHDAKYSVTHYKMIRVKPPYSLLEVDLETGRKHQIRVHLADFGHPIAGDEKYGPGPKIDPAGRLGLHAFRLAFEHPVSGKKMFFESELPPALKKMVGP